MAAEIKARVLSTLKTRRNIIVNVLNLKKNNLAIDYSTTYLQRRIAIILKNEILYLKMKPTSSLKLKRLRIIIVFLYNSEMDVDNSIVFLGPNRN